MIHAKTKPNNGLRGVAFSWASFDLWPTNHISFARFHVQIINKLKIWSNWCIVLCLESFQRIDTLVYAVFTAFFVPFRIQTYQCSRWRCLFTRYFFFRICSLSSASPLPNFVRKQATIWKITNIETICISWKNINPSMPWLILWLLQKFVSCENQTYQCCKWSCLSVRCFFFPVCILPTASTMPNFMRKWAQSWKNKDIGSMFMAWKVLKPV